MSNQLTELLGKIVSFKVKNNVSAVEFLGEYSSYKGLVVGVCINLDKDHEVCIRDFDDVDVFYKLSELESFKIAEIDPLAFFENIKKGNLELTF